MDKKTLGALKKAGKEAYELVKKFHEFADLLDSIIASEEKTTVKTVKKPVVAIKKVLQKKAEVKPVAVEPAVIIKRKRGRPSKK
jgi:hypothetical protein